MRFLAITALALTILSGVATAASTAKPGGTPPTNMPAGSTPSAAPSPPTVLPRNITPCGTVVGGFWQLATRHGNVWDVHAKQAPCSFARNWVARLTRRSGQTGPIGWTCHRPSPAGKPATSGGSCAHGLAMILWGIPARHP